MYSVLIQINVCEIPFVHLYNGYNSDKSNNNKKTLISQSSCEHQDGERLLIKVVL